MENLSLTSALRHLRRSGSLTSIAAYTLMGNCTFYALAVFALAMIALIIAGVLYDIFAGSDTNWVDIKK